MDRLASFLRWWPALPLLGLVLIGALLLAARWTAPQPAGDTPPAEMRPPTFPADTEFARAAVEPGLLCVRCRARRLLPLAGPTPTILQAGFASEQDVAPRVPRRESGLLLLSPERPGKRSEQLERIAREADRQTQHGFELAGRGAYFAARSEFIGALRLVAQGLDAEHQTTTHSRSLAAALAAIKEAEDFIPKGPQLEGNLDVAAIIGAHRTPVLKSAETESLTPLVALKCYFTFAQEQLASAVGREVAGSMALHALGKLYAALAVHQRSGVRAAEPKAMTYYQAALLACPGNHMAANDLGVLLARCGNYRQAQTMLKHSLSMHQESTCWHNLAAVYRRLGRAGLAQRADRHSAAVQHVEIARRKALSSGSRQPVRWVDPKTFAQSNSKNPGTGPPIPVRPKPTNAKLQEPAPTNKNPTIGWLPWTLQKKR